MTTMTAKAELAPFLARLEAGRKTRAARAEAPPKRLRLDAQTLATAGASEFLALDPAAMTRAVALAAEPSGAATLRAAVGVVDVCGPLAQRAYLDGETCAFVDGYDFIVARLRAALADDSVDAVVVRIDSPGGEVPGLDEATTRIRAAIAEAGKPVLVHIDEQAASAGYWLAAGVATDGIYAPAMGRVGCIGVLGAVWSTAKALEMAGVEVAVVGEPAGKADQHAATPIADRAVGRKRAMVAELADRFYAHVAAARGLTPKAVKALDAETFLGPDAKERGLIDGVQSFEATVALAAEKGREARQKREETMQTEKELARLQAFEKSVQAVTGTTDGTAAVAKIEALKIENDQFRGKAGQVAELEAKITALESAKAEGDLVALVARAVEDGRIEPAGREKFLADARAKGGVAFAEAVLAHLPPRAAVAGPKIVPAKVEGVDAALGELLAKTGMTDEDLNAAKAAGLV